MRVLFLGDVFGSPGRRAVRHFVPKLRRSLGIDLASLQAALRERESA